MRRITQLAACVALFLIVTVAHGQSADTAKADRLFREGRELMKEGKYDEACSKLEESHRIDPAPGTAINLGDCFDKVGKVASALLAYQAARKLLPASDPRLAPVRQQIAMFEKRVPRLTVRVAKGTSPDATVRRDGREVEPGARAIVNPGEHVVVVSSPGREDGRYTVRLAEAESRVLTVEVGAPVAAPTREAGARADHQRERNSVGEAGADDGSSQRTLGYLVGGTGVVLLAVGGYFWSKAQSTSGTQCPPGDCNALQDEEQGQRTVANITLPAGLAGVAGGIALVLFAPKRSNSSALLHANPVSMSYAVNVEGVW